MYAQTGRISEEAAPVNSKLHELMRDLEETERFLAGATLESTTPEEFATETAREVLLARVVADAVFAHRQARDSHEASQKIFEREYDTYLLKLRRLRDRVDSSGYILSMAELQRDLNDIQRMIEA
jgi:hypothetical protein